MVILAQHGWGKTNKIQRGMAAGSIGGAILSPRDESPANLSSFLSDMSANYPNAELLVDPQFYVGTIWPVRHGKLDQYRHYSQHLTPSSFTPTAIQGFVTDVLGWQDSLDVSAYVSPTVIVDSLGSQWDQIAMMFAQESVNQHNGTKPLLVSLVVSEDALRQRVPVDNWLNEITQLDVDGFYLIVRRTSDSYRQHYDPEVLASLLGVCYSLAELNEYRVYAGYTDMATLLLHALSVHGTGAGWYATLKQFTLRRFQPATGGRRARTRYSSRPLLNSIYMSELDAIFNGGQVVSVLSTTPLDARFTSTTNPENVPWPDDDAALHHWHVLADIVSSLAGPTVSDRLDSARNLIAQARSLYAQIGVMVPFLTETGPTHLDQWLDGLDRFRIQASV